MVFPFNARTLECIRQGLTAEVSHPRSTPGRHRRGRPHAGQRHTIVFSKPSICEPGAPHSDFGGRAFSGIQASKNLCTEPYEPGPLDHQGASASKAMSLPQHLIRLGQTGGLVPQGRAREYVRVEPCPWDNDACGRGRVFRARRHRSAAEVGERLRRGRNIPGGGGGYSGRVCIWILAIVIGAWPAVCFSASPINRAKF
jgi:hypothetical protein